MMSLKYCYVYACLILVSCGAVVYACHGKLLTSGITKEERQIILQEHNRLRQKVATGRFPGQPAAENMREIVWDDELAARAQQWAENCQFRHDPHRTINRFTMGQNLAIIWSTAPLDPDDGDFPSRIRNWFNEVQKYSFGDAWSPKTGHYSQLVWGETSLIGCGFAEYKDTTKYNKLYVCNYGPGGNIVGYNPYEVGKPACVTYGLRASSRYQGLCAGPSTVANSISSNAIETYDFHTSKPVNKISGFGAPQGHQAPGAYTLQIAPSRGSPYGIATHGGSAAYATEASQRSKYEYNHKLETYKPTASEYQNSVLKHTVLRAFLTQSPEQQEKQPAQQSAQESLDPTNGGNVRGWSLLTWRG